MGPQGDPNPEVLLATVSIKGKQVSQTRAIEIADRLDNPAANIESIQPTAEALEKSPITRTRTITFSEPADGKSFFIDGEY